MRVIDRTDEDNVPILIGWHHGHLIYQCNICTVQRRYGFGGDNPENKTALILCEGDCKGKHTWHTFVKTY